MAFNKKIEDSIERAIRNGIVTAYNLPYAVLEAVDDEGGDYEVARNEIRRLGDEVRKRGFEPTEASADAIMDIVKANMTPQGRELRAIYNTVYQSGMESHAARQKAKAEGEHYTTPRKSVDPITRAIHKQVLKHDRDASKQLGRLSRWTSQTAEKHGINAVDLSQEMARRSTSASEEHVVDRIAEETNPHSESGYSGYDALDDFRNLSIDSLDE
jgi:hypothetical protein